jgi:RNA polymerase sigma-70 factor (ECF subfamily)
MLFQRILSNSTLDWFRRQKTRKPFSPLQRPGVFRRRQRLRLAGNYATNSDASAASNAESLTERKQTLQSIEKEIQELPARQREAFLMRYWEEMDVAETAAAMGCSEGSVKTHCFRAIQTLSKALKAKGIEL